MSESSPGEALLLSEGIINRRSEQRRAVLRCLGCIWSRREEEGKPSFALAAEIMSCNKTSTSVSYGGASTTLKKLRDSDVISATKGAGEDKYSLVYAPSDSYSGQLLARALRPVPACKTPLQETANDSLPFRSGVKRSILYPTTQTIPGLVHALRDCREKLNLTKEEAAAALGIERPKFAIQESTGRMTFDVFMRYAGFLGLEIGFRETGNSPGSGDSAPMLSQEFTVQYPQADQ